MHNVDRSLLSYVVIHKPRLGALNLFQNFDFTIAVEVKVHGCLQTPRFDGFCKLVLLVGIEDHTLSANLR